MMKTKHEITSTVKQLRQVFDNNADIMLH